ncbi:DNA-binding transcriptional LysR family regulator [Salirhabdus euzebyi]|uniref:DNA-binding transcriptional LysR family regulator n=1 Tax=Salirhabdus euzebyi TaxID=394506 RepID=A0A841PVL4_9BACI|nr:LysR family transcriptional regulator [Salirhabdus euzebyi]MBB6451774.1 DNA-binding transcriptional LysR family regulator [Salirhabdus euzebyi]
MEFNQLKTFYSVATHLNFTKAAEELSLSQPAVSRQIDALENYYEVPLFYRTKKKVELTDAGRQLLKYAVQIISMADQADKALTSLSNLESGELIVGCGTTIGTYVITNLVIDFQKKHPSIKVKLIIDNTSNIIDKLENNKIDLAIIAKRFDDSKFNYQPLFQDKINAYCSVEQKEKYKNLTSVTELNAETILLREIGSHTRECVEKQLNNIDYSKNNIVELSTNEAIKQAILNSNGIGFLSSTTVHIELKHHLLYEIPLQEKCQREFSVISPKGKYTSPIMLIFSSFLTKNIRKFS